MNKIQATLLCIISAAVGTALICIDHADNSWISRSVVCYALVIIFAFLGYYDAYIRKVRLIRVTTDMLVHYSSETPESVRNMITIAENDASITDEKRQEVIDGYKQVLELFTLDKTMPSTEDLNRVTTNCWYMGIISTIILLINVAWIHELFSELSTLILMVVYVILLTKSINIMRGKDHGKGKTTLWK